MSKGIPRLKGGNHIGFTVPDIEEATTFFVDVTGCSVLYGAGLLFVMIG